MAGPVTGKSGSQGTGARDGGTGGSQALSDVWEQVFAGRDACVTLVLSLAEAATSAGLRERGTFVDWGGVPQPAPAPRLSASAVIERPRSRRCGHTDQILAELGYAAGEIAVLRAGEAVD
jgi:alpha-methylacyl-CoA racemase